MSRSVSRRLGTAAVAVLAGLALVATSGPAQAATKSSYKSSGRTVTLDWLEVGALPGGVEGNIHFGFMQVVETSKGRATAWGEVYDVECPDGVVPDQPPFGGHGEEPEGPDELGCTLVDVRWIEGGALTLTMDNKFSSAVLGGTLNVYGHDGPAGNPPVSIRVDGVGGTFKETGSGSYRDQYESFTYTYSFTGRSGQVASGSRIGAMVFDDADGEYSGAQLGSFKETNRSRSR
jgi:hypothetical protein